MCQVIAAVDAPRSCSPDEHAGRNPGRVRQISDACAPKVRPPDYASLIRATLAIPSDFI
jgi:hypothetical protein